MTPRELTNDPERSVVRIALLDRAKRVMLLRIRDASGRLAWGLPGGGVEAGETDEGAARRELMEEFGVGDVVIGPLIWTREHVFPVAGSVVLWRERHHLAHLSAGKAVHEHARWWTADELRRTRARFSPPALRISLYRLLAEGPPPDPIDLGETPFSGR